MRTDWVWRLFSTSLKALRSTLLAQLLLSCVFNGTLTPSGRTPLVKLSCTQKKKTGGSLQSRLAQCGHIHWACLYCSRRDCSGARRWPGPSGEIQPARWNSDEWLGNPLSYRRFRQLCYTRSRHGVFERYHAGRFCRVIIVDAAGFRTLPHCPPPRRSTRCNGLQ